MANELKYWFVNEVEERLKREGVDEKIALFSKLLLLTDGEKQLNIAEDIARKRLEDEIEYLKKFSIDLLKKRYSEFLLDKKSIELLKTL